MSEVLKVHDVVVTGSITVKHPEAEIGLVIEALPSGAGIWVGGDTFVTLQAINGLVYFGVGRNNEKAGDAIAISIDDKGEPSLQLCRPGKEAKILSGEALDKLFKD